MVISIIALLVAILLPALSAARDVAEMTQCLSNERQMTLGVIQYADAFNEYLPVRRYNGNTSQYAEFGFVRHVGPMNRLTYMNLIPALDTTNPYNSGSIRFCPTLAPLRPSSSVSSDNGGVQGLAHYVMSLTMTGYTHASNGTTNPSHKRMLDIKNPSSVYLLTEAESFEAPINAVNFLSVQDDVLSTRFRAGGDFVGTTANQAYTAVGELIQWRHMEDKVNFAFADGHCETRAYDWVAGSFGEIHFVDHE